MSVCLWTQGWVNLMDIGGGGGGGGGGWLVVMFQIVVHVCSTSVNLSAFSLMSVV